MEGKALIQRLFKAIDVLKGDIKIAYYENYDMAMGKLITSGVDLWLNTPQPPLEASGTSGMKAALNGVPSFSSLDGWWIEGHIENLTGWSIGRDGSALDEFRDPAEDARSLYEKLEKVILPLYYKDRDKYINIMAHAISLNGAYFNTSRMVQDYVTNAYFSTNGRTIRW
jgi:starch phosphorylase